MFPPTSSYITSWGCLFLSLLAWVAAKLLVRRYELRDEQLCGAAPVLQWSALHLKLAFGFWRCTVWRSTGQRRLPPTVFTYYYQNYRPAKPNPFRVPCSRSHTRSLGPAKFDQPLATGDPSVSVSQFKADISRVKGERSNRYVPSGCCLSPFSHKVFTSVSHCKPRSILLRHNSHLLLLLLLLTGSISHSSNDHFISFILVGKTTH